MNGLRKLGRILMVALVLMALVLAIAMPATVEAQVNPTTVENALTNGTLVVIAASAQSNMVASSVIEIDVWQHKGIAFLPTLSSTNASTAQVGISYVVSVDGTNYSTSEFWQVAALNGTSAVRPYTNYNAQLLDNARKVKINKITNGHNASLFVTNVLAGRGP
jgi:hypothetical protein